MAKVGMLLVTLITMAIAVGESKGDTKDSATKMKSAASKFLASLTAEQKAKAQFSFDDRERLNWHYIPLVDSTNSKPTRKGLALAEMSPVQKRAAFGLVETGTSSAGFEKVKTIIEFESLLRTQEKGSSFTRNPDWYFVSIFGNAEKSEFWGWRFEGHHLSLNFTLKGDDVVSATPAFFGANPAEVKTGMQKGYRTLATHEDLARQLFASLDEEQKMSALQPRHFPQISGGNPNFKVGRATGLPAVKMNSSQRAILLKLQEAYLQIWPEDIAKSEREAISTSERETLTFGYSGGAEKGQPHTYRVQGPSLFIDYNCEQSDSLGNPGNHIHSVYRVAGRDFGVGTTQPKAGDDKGKSTN